MGPPDDTPEEKFFAALREVAGDTWRELAEGSLSEEERHALFRPFDDDEMERMVKAVLYPPEEH